MARKKEVPDEVKEQIRAMLISNTMSNRAIARELGVSESTVRREAKALEKEGQYVKVTPDTQVTPAAINVLTQNDAGASDAVDASCTVQDLIIAEHLKNKKIFVEKAWQTLFKAQELVMQKIVTATVATEQFEPMLKELIKLLKEGGLGAQDIKDTLMMFGKLMDIPLNHLSTFIGTQFDKMSLAAGEANSRNEVTGKDGGPITIKVKLPEE